LQLVTDTKPIANLTRGEARYVSEFADRLTAAGITQPGSPPQPDRQGGELVRLRPMRVLVISHDRPFRTVTALLLPRRGCAVATTPRASQLPELVDGERADVVVIDADQLPASWVRAVMTVDGWPIGVVIVADEAGPGLHDRPLVAKWGPFGDLFAAIEQADASRGL
jgi:hypothetical protein